MKRLLFLLFFSTSALWADGNILSVVQDSSATGSDIIYKVDGSANDRYITLNNLFSNLGPAYFIANQNTLQSGSVFNVSSASVQGPLLLNYTGSNDNGNFPGTPLFIVGSTNTYLQAVMQNLNSGSAASTDFIATSDQGNNNQDYVDMGINSSQYSQSGFSAVPSTWAYLYSSDHGLFIGADTNNSDSTSALEFGVAGQNMSNVEMEILNDGAIVHIGSTTFLGNISLSSGVFDGSNSAGTSGQVLTSRGAGTSPTWQASGGSSGGLVSLSTGVTGVLPAVNIDTNVITVDVGCTSDGGGSYISTGIACEGARFDYSATISSWTVVNLSSGSVTWDIWRTANGASSWTPTSGTSIVGSGTFPSVTTAYVNAASPSSWTSTQINAGDFIDFVVSSSTSAVKSNLQLTLKNSRRTHEKNSSVFTFTRAWFCRLGRQHKSAGD